MFSEGKIFWKVPRLIWYLKYQEGAHKYLFPTRTTLNMEQSFHCWSIWNSVTFIFWDVMLPSSVLTYSISKMQVFLDVAICITLDISLIQPQRKGIKHFLFIIWPKFCWTHQKMIHCATIFHHWKYMYQRSILK